MRSQFLYMTYYLTSLIIERESNIKAYKQCGYCFQREHNFSNNKNSLKTNTCQHNSLCSGLGGQRESQQILRVLQDKQCFSDLFHKLPVTKVTSNLFFSFLRDNWKIYLYIIFCASTHRNIIYYIYTIRYEYSIPKLCLNMQLDH